MVFRVYLIHRRDKFTADQTFVDKIKNLENIDLKYNSVVSTLNEKDDVLNSITLSDGTEIPCSGLFIYIGQECFSYRKFPCLRQCNRYCSSELLFQPELPEE